MLGYSIPGIGLGNYGLSPDGTYASYDLCMPGMMATNPIMTDPSIFGANPSFGYANGIMMNGLGAYGGYGMYGMYNPAFMAQMQNQIEEMQLDHSGRMHQKMKEHQVKNYRETNSAVIGKTLTDASVQQGVQNLRAKVIEGDQDGICQEFDKLRNQVLETYKDEIIARAGKENPMVAAGQIVELLYSNIVGANLRNDILKHGDGALANGFMKGFRKGHHDRFVDETMNHCFGLPIDHKQSKEVRQGIGKASGTVTSIIEKGAYGAGAGAIAYSLAWGASKTAKLCGRNGLTFNAKHLGRVSAITACLAILGDIAWKVFDSDKASA